MLDHVQKVFENLAVFLQIDVKTVPILILSTAVSLGNLFFIVRRWIKGSKTVTKEVTVEVPYEVQVPGPVQYVNVPAQVKEKRVEVIKYHTPGALSLKLQSLLSESAQWTYSFGKTTKGPHFNVSNGTLLFKGELDRDNKMGITELQNGEVSIVDNIPSLDWPYLHTAFTNLVAIKHAEYEKAKELTAKKAVEALMAKSQGSATPVNKVSCDPGFSIPSSINGWAVKV